MSGEHIAFYRREHCPGCASCDIADLYRLPFSDDRLKRFIEEFYAHRIEYRLLEGSDYEIGKCRQCDLLFQRHVLNEAGQDMLYGEWVDNRKSLEKKRNAGSKLFHQYAGQLQAVDRFFKKRPDQVKILEFGMGWGYWSRLATAFGYDVTGLELSTERVEHARGLGVRVVQQISDADDSFDFIYASQVFEHLENPLRTLLDLKDRLKEGGIIYLRVPDARGMEKRLRIAGWQPDMDAIHPLEHINGFTRKSLCAMAYQAGLRVKQPPVRIEISKLWSGLKREVTDRWFTTHVYFTG